jgi:hypothetical protein
MHVCICMCQAAAAAARDRQRIADLKRQQCITERVGQARKGLGVDGRGKEDEEDEDEEAVVVVEGVQEVKEVVHL